ncbi:hypothetical protein MAR621_03043 [Maribacter dokdonensis]|mgnify:CR=1 FL=1|nr:hypothetical protein MAR621_03043 [Maribacter dokdonensis]|tara:strand:+ start:1151 stop:1483 length:333 start_codon:yes stop_codon:yes gene_type:complete
MVVLKKIRASSLMETLVATVLIVIIFMISSMVLNNIISGNIRQNTEKIEERMNRLEYEFKNRAIALPYQEDFETWHISMLEDSRKPGLIVLEAINTKTNVAFSKSIVDGY